jgi:hypothetical protein
MCGHRNFGERAVLLTTLGSTRCFSAMEFTLTLLGYAALAALAAISLGGFAAAYAVVLFLGKHSSGHTTNSRPSS